MPKTAVNYLLILLFLISLLSCETTNKKNLGSDTHRILRINQDSISFELCKLYASDQGIRNRDLFSSTDGRLIEKIDSSNFYQLVSIIKLIGIPKAEKLGASNFSNECVEGAFGAIMLHNPHILLRDSLILNLFIERVEEGDLKAEALATILDKYYWAKSGGQKVLYGSQFGQPCLSGKEETNSAREKIGLAPLKDEGFKECP